MLFYGALMKMPVTGRFLKEQRSVTNPSSTHKPQHFPDADINPSKPKIPLIPLEQTSNLCNLDVNQETHSCKESFTEIRYENWNSVDVILSIMLSEFPTNESKGFIFVE